MSTLTPEAIASLKSRLHDLYADGSKHAVYQNVPEFVREAIGYREGIDEGWRSDTPRYEYFAPRLGLPTAATIADVGANTGYFALNLARSHPGFQLHAFEPNPRHARFIQEIATVFALPNLTVRPEPWTMGNLAQVGRFDAIFLLNILHHAGFDFDQQLPDRNDAFEAYVTEYLDRVRQRARLMCFQIGSNRGGDKTRPLFNYDDDISRFEWCCRQLTSSGWRIRQIGIAGRNAAGRIDYADLPVALLTAAQVNRIRTPAFSDFFHRANLGQFPGEFYRRSLFICEAI